MSAFIVCIYIFVVGLFLILVSVFSFFSCEDEDDTVNEPYLIVKFQFILH